MENQTPDTGNHLNWVEIKNFKSIKDLRLDCKRVNVFIGKPNVGKSNILEGLGLLGAEYSGGKFMNGMMRYQTMNHLFSDNNSEKIIEIITNQDFCTLKRTSPFSRKSFEFYSGDNLVVEKVLSMNRDSHDDYDSRLKYILDNEKNITMIGLSEDGTFNKTVRMKGSFPINMPIVKKYDFANLTKFDLYFHNFLLPPNGTNLYEVVRRNKELWGDFAKLFVDQQLELVLDDEKQEFVLQKKDGMFVTQYPYFSIADTFRRYVFYVTAIESNSNSVIIFEEPEVHSFPPYTQELAYRIAYDETNQYFISTHSPYLLKTLIENVEYENINVFVTYYENYETKVKALSKEDFRDILDYSTDVFFNLDRLIPHAPKNTVLP